MSTRQGGRWSNECLSRDIFSTLAEFCSRCCLFWIHISRKPRSRRERMAICRSSAFIPKGNGRSASFSTPTCLRSFLHGSQAMRAASHPRQRPPMSLSGRGSGRHLRRCNHPMPGNHNRPTQEGNRDCNTRPKPQECTRCRSLSWRSGNRNLVGSGTACGGEVNRRGA
jgi:hypothetical protein